MSTWSKRNKNYKVLRETCKRSWAKVKKKTNRTVVLCFTRLQQKLWEQRANFYCFTEGVCLEDAPPSYEGQNKMEAGGCNNDNPKVGGGKANVKTKGQASSGKKSGTLYVVSRGTGSGNGRARSGQREGRIIFPWNAKVWSSTDPG